MTLPTKEHLLKEIIKMEKVFSIQLDFDDLEKRGIVERKKNTKRTYAILKPDEFPMDAINQTNSLTQVTITKNKKEKSNKVYFKFPAESKRIKTLNDYKKMKKQLMS